MDQFSNGTECHTEVLKQAIVDAIGYDMKAVYVSMQSVSSLDQIISLVYSVCATTYVFHDADIATAAFITALNESITHGFFDSNLRANAASCGDEFQFVVTEYVLFTTPSPTSAPTSAPTSLDLVTANAFQVSWSSDYVKTKARFYLASYLLFFLAIYVVLFAVDKSEVFLKLANNLASSSFQSQVHLHCTAADAPAGASIKRMAKLHKLDKYILEMDAQEGASRVNTGGDSHSGAASLKLISYSLAYHHYLQQKRTLLSCAPVIYPQGLRIGFLGCTLMHFEPGLYEDFILHLFNNNQLLGCMLGLRGSFYSRNGRKLVYLTQNTISFFISAFTGSLFNYYGLGYLLNNVFDVLVISPTSVFAGDLVRYIYTIRYNNDGSVLHSLSHMPFYNRIIAALLFIASMMLMFMAALFTYNNNKIGILQQYVLQVLLVSILVDVASSVLVFVSNYHLNVSVCNVSVLNVGLRFLEKIIRYNLQENRDYYVVKSGTWLCNVDYVVSAEFARKKDGCTPIIKAMQEAMLVTSQCTRQIPCLSMKASMVGLQQQRHQQSSWTYVSRTRRLR